VERSLIDQIFSAYTLQYSSRWITDGSILFEKDNSPLTMISERYLDI